MILRTVFDHVTIRASDLDASTAFYTTLLGAPTHGPEWDDFGIYAGPPVTTGVHVAFVARSRNEVEATWQRAVDAGYRSDGEPGPRPEYGDDYYGAFLLDPDGNSAESVYHGREREGEFRIDHLWVGVSDLERTLRFYETIAPVLGLRIATVRAERFHVAAGDRSFALVADGRPPAANLHIAFPAPDDATVAEFHRPAVAAGYRDNGAPGERPEYHPGYVGAFVLDPDGTNVEAVNHNR
jgi:catechol 2,3-dioxygenase-like lactoylglutathione lyase family enzyme